MDMFSSDGSEGDFIADEIAQHGITDVRLIMMSAIGARGSAHAGAYFRSRSRDALKLLISAASFRGHSGLCVRRLRPAR